MNTTFFPWFASAIGAGSTPVLRGIIVEIRREADEAPDFTWHSIVMLGYGCFLVFTLMPFLIALYIAAGTLIKRMVSIAAILLKFKVLASHMGMSRDEVPVMFLRITDVAGRDHYVRAKGRLRGGTFSVGDQVVVWGRARGGLIKMDRATNLSTGSEVTTVGHWGGALAGWLVFGTVVVVSLSALLLITHLFIMVNTQ